MRAVGAGNASREKCMYVCMSAYKYMYTYILYHVKSDRYLPAWTSTNSMARERAQGLLCRYMYAGMLRELNSAYPQMPCVILLLPARALCVCIYTGVCVAMHISSTSLHVHLSPYMYTYRYIDACVYVGICVYRDVLPG